MIVMINKTLWIPIFLMVLMAPFTPFLDLTSAHYFFDWGGENFLSNSFLSFMFQYGVWPANIVVGVSIILLLSSFFYLSLVKYRKIFIYLILTLALGSGVITHLVLKDHWGRPRPRQVIEFKGEQTFSPFYIPNFSNPIPSKSFPCGHCSMGFYFFSLAIVGKRLGKLRFQKISLFIAFFLGGLLGIVRMAQGGHFFSDVLMGALVMWLTALFLEWVLFKRYNQQY